MLWLRVWRSPRLFTSSSAVVTVAQESRGVLGSSTRGIVGVWFGRGTPGTGGRVSLETDGQSHIGRDVLIAALLVAKRLGFETAPLIAMGKSLRVFLSTS